MSKATHNLTYGLFVLTAHRDGKDNGCIINTLSQATTDPNQVLITVNKANYTHDMILETRKFTASIISEAADFSLFQRFGFASGRDTDKFAGFTGCRRVFNDTLAVTEGTNGYISAWVTQTVDLGTHTLFIATVTDMDVLSDVPSASYAYYQSNIKPARKPAEAPTGKTVWVCKVCGYEYEGEKLPEGFICPVCKHPAEDFEKAVK